MEIEIEAAYSAAEGFKVERPHRSLSTRARQSYECCGRGRQEWDVRGDTLETWRKRRPAPRSSVIINPLSTSAARGVTDGHDERPRITPAGQESMKINIRITVAH